ncbi:MATE family efflux transporter [Hwanghaeella sp. LZ110]|jgi:MATE family, multidrug efflux pump|uniref:MATE family efflux transporter n=1 Tax=Hwanghaeella sp. LZ110 TaxID=3402810 RepID=UPI003B674D0A
MSENSQPAPYSSPQRASGQSGLSWFFSRFNRHTHELFRLAGPVVISRAGILTLALTDTIMLGPLGAEEVGRYGLGTSAFILLLVCGIGLMFGTVVETSHLRGAGRVAETGQVWRRALPYGIVLGIVGVVMTQFAETYFLLVGQDPHLAKISASVTHIQGIGLLPLMIYMASNYYLEAMGRPVPGMIIVWGVNLVNIPLNLWLIHGGLGVEGADGAALATTICRTLMMIGVTGYVWYLGGRQEYGIRQRPQPGWIAGGKVMRRHGYAAGPAYAAESGAYHVLHIYAGWMAANELASFTVNMNLLSMIFMISLGIANATAVRVGVAHGRRDWPDRALAGWTGMFWNMVLLLPIAVILWFLPEQTMAYMYQITDEKLLHVMAPATMLVGVAMMLDGGQFTLANALRGTGDKWSPTFINLVGFIGSMIPAAYIIGIVMERGAQGLYEAILLGATLACIVLVVRWTWVCAKRARQSDTL